MRETIRLFAWVLKWRPCHQAINLRQSLCVALDIGQVMILMKASRFAYSLPAFLLVSFLNIFGAVEFLQTASQAKSDVGKNG